MKVGLIASLVIHVAGLAALPGREAPPAPTAESVAASCRCDYEVTITDARPPRALTLGVVPADRLKQ
ncbi:MAG TPA: hypothetical protein VF395_06190 [Polyangiaceae bacterium]